MSKPLFLALLTILILAGAGYIYTTGSTDLSSTTAQPTPTATQLPNSNQTSTTTSQPNPASQSKSGYVVFTPQILDQPATARRVLFFYANWCPTCRPADQSFTQNSSQFPSDLTVIRVNYNDDETEPAEKELAKKYGITYQHTYVLIDEQGNALKKWNGGGFEELLENL
jgi:thioredoxin 1